MSTGSVPEYGGQPAGSSRLRPDRLLARLVPRARRRLRRSPIELLLLVVLGVALAVAAVSAPTDRRDLIITSPGDGAQIAGNIVVVRAIADEPERPSFAGGEQPRWPRFFVFVDRDPVAPGTPIPTGRDVVGFAGRTVEIHGLSVGRHRFTVVKADRRRWRESDVQDETSVTITGPSVQVLGPRSTSSRDVTLQLQAEGVPIRRPGSRDGGGHFAIFVDRRPTLVGDAVPADVPRTSERETVVRGLAPGVHTIWVLLVHQNDRPYRPRVADRIVVRVEGPSDGASDDGASGDLADGDLSDGGAEEVSPPELP
jgi:hypothetical protein